MLAIVSRIEALAVSGAAAIVDAKDDVAVIYEVLSQRIVADARLPAGSAVNQEHRGRLVLRRGPERLVQDVRNGQAVEGPEAHDLGRDQIPRVDLFREHAGQSRHLVRSELVDV